VIRVKEFQIGVNDAGARLDRFVAKAAPLVPASLAQKYIRTKRIKVNGRGSARDRRLAVGDAVQMYVNDEFFDSPGEDNAYLRVTDPALDIVYEDGNILLVNKPAGVLCHSDGGYDYSTLIARVQAHTYRKREWDPRRENSFAPALCNRIDRNTSGIVVAAKNAEALRVMNEKIKLREIDKYYLAAVNGLISPPKGRLEGYIFKDSVKNRVFVSRVQKPGAVFAATEYRTLKTANRLTLLECRLITGRTHQIRAQLADAGYPLVGDGKYGKPGGAAGERYQLLCSYRLAFSFRTPAGPLEYLNGREFRLERVDFAEKYFGA
jgi:23S rRNA pseudouridine955/2504/2580 synthase